MGGHSIIDHDLVHHYLSSSARWLRPKLFRRLPVKGRHQRRASTGGEADPSIHRRVGLTIDEGAAALRLCQKDGCSRRAAAQDEVDSWSERENALGKTGVPSLTSGVSSVQKSPPGRTTGVEGRELSCRPRRDPVDEPRWWSR